MAELFDRSPQNITIHLKALYEEGEISEEATCKDFLQVRLEGELDDSVVRNFRTTASDGKFYDVQFYNLEGHSRRRFPGEISPRHTVSRRALEEAGAAASIKSLEDLGKQNSK